MMNTAHGISVFSDRIHLHGQVRIDHCALLTLNHLELKSGVITSILGPNGSGKSTLLRALSGTLDPQLSTNLSPSLFAHQVQALGADHQVVMPLSVREVLQIPPGGAERGAPFFDSRKDWLRRMGSVPSLERSFASLSHGQRQKVMLAWALGSCPRFLLLDETLAALDLTTQDLVLSLLSDWVKSPQTDSSELRSVIWIAHDWFWVRRWAHQAVLLHQGEVVASGDLSTVLTRENLGRAYDFTQMDSQSRLALQKAMFDGT